MLGLGLVQFVGRGFACLHITRCANAVPLLFSVGARPEGDLVVARQPTYVARQTLAGQDGC